MKSIGFVGKFDKTDLVQYVAKVIATMGKETMFIDATSTQKTKHTIPVIPGTELQTQYITEHDGIQIAVGFGNVLELKKYMLSKGEDFNEYEYILIDVDNEEMCEEYDMKSANNLFFVSSYDKMALNKGTDLLKYICATKRREDPEGLVDLQKITYYSDVNSADARYIDMITENLPLRWENKDVNLPYDAGDISINIQNQYSSKIDFKGLSSMYKQGVMEIVSKITGTEMKELKKVVKNVEHTASFQFKR